MSDLTEIQKQNEIAATRKYQARARAMNSAESHPKKAAPCKRSLSDRLAKIPKGACRGLDNLG